MAVDYTTGVITSPIVVNEVSDLIGIPSYKVHQICKSDKVNKYAKHKPYAYLGEESPWLSSAGLTWLKDNQWGIAINDITADSQWAITEQQIKTRIAWEHNNIPGNEDAKRIHDFRGYNHNAASPFSFGGNFGKTIQADGNTISVHGISVNGSANNLVVTLQDIKVSSAYPNLNSWYLGLAFYDYGGASNGQFAYMVTDSSIVGLDNMSGQSRTYNISLLDEGSYLMFLILSPTRYCTLDDDGYPIGTTTAPSHRIVIPEDGFRYVIITRQSSLIGTVLFYSSDNLYSIRSSSAASVYMSDNNYSHIIFGNNGQMTIQPNMSNWDTKLDTTYMMRRLVISPAYSGEGFFGYLPNFTTDNNPYVDDNPFGRVPGLDRYINIAQWDDIDNISVNLLLCWHNNDCIYLDESNVAVYYQRQLVVVRGGDIEQIYDIDTQTDLYAYYVYDDDNGWQVSQHSFPELSEISIANEDNADIKFVLGDESATISIPSGSRINFNTQSALTFGGWIELDGGGCIQFPAGNIKYLYTVDGQK